MNNAIFICRNPKGAQWALGDLSTATGDVTLIGWRVTSTPVDAGVPEAVAGVMARALVSAARVVFSYSGVKELVPSAWTPIDDGDMIRALGDDSLGARLRGALRGASSDAVLLTTRRPDRAARLFDDPAHPWWMQGQVALLVDPDLPPPEIDRRTLFALLEDDWLRQAAALRAIGIGGVLRPGVDGDVAGLLALDRALGNSLLAALEDESRSSGFEWAAFSEDEFERHLADETEASRL